MSIPILGLATVSRIILLEGVEGLVELVSGAAVLHEICCLQNLVET